MAFIEAGPRVAETSPTTGTGSFSLAGAVSASYETFAAVCADGDTVPYWAIDDANAWEFGIGTYTASGNLLARTTRLGSSTGSAISFAANKTVFLGYQGLAFAIQYATAKTSLADTDKLGLYDSVTGKLRSATWALVRSTFPNLLTANKTIYVRKDGSDSNDGSANDAGHAFLTVMRAVKEAYKYATTLDGVVNIQLGTGTWSEYVKCFGSVHGLVEAATANIYINGNGAANTTIDGAGYAAVAALNCTVNVSALKITNASGHGVSATESGVLNVGTGVEFGACSGAQIVSTEGGIVYTYESCTISGSAAFHMWAWGGHIEGGFNTITLTGTPAFSSAFVQSEMSSNIYHQDTTFIGACTGHRFRVEQGGHIATYTDDLFYFPGDADGQFVTGGSYNGIFAGQGAVLVANLPNAAECADGTSHVVSDANSTTFLAAVVGGGANTVPVKVIGGAWKIA